MADVIVIACQCCNNPMESSVRGRKRIRCDECRKSHKYDLKLARFGKERRKPKQASTCIICTQSFIAKQSEQKTCSSKCGAKLVGLLKRKFNQPTQCAFCGSVSVPGNSTQKELRRDPNYKAYCDVECANEAKKFAYRSEEYREKIGWHETREKERQLEIQKAKDRYKSCGWCWNTHSTGNLYCSSKCQYERDKYARVQLRLSSIDWSKAKCKECGGQIPRAKNKKADGYCSTKCSRRAGKRMKRHRLRNASFAATSISMATIRKKYKNKCVLCGTKCITADGTYNTKHATMDHIVPLSKGGLHIESNIQLMCFGCNSKKRDTVPPMTQMFLPWT